MPVPSLKRVSTWRHQTMWPIAARAHAIWLILRFSFQISQIETSAGCLEPCYLWSLRLVSGWPWISFLGKQCHSVKIGDILNQDHIDKDATKAITIRWNALNFTLVEWLFDSVSSDQPCKDAKRDCPFTILVFLVASQWWRPEYHC